MKAKKLLPVLALTLAATTFAACGDKSVTFGHYWFKDSLTKEANFFEQAEYIVTSKPSESGYSNYKVDYTGNFTTTLEYSATENIYTFATKLEVTAIFALGETTKELKDTATAWVKFDGEGNALRPLSSYKKMLCHTPLNGTFESVETCYATVDYEYSADYEKNELKGNCKITNNRNEEIDMDLSNTFDFLKNYTFIDNEQILIAVRGFAADTVSATVSTYSAFAESMQKVKFSFTDADENASETFNYTLISADGTENTATKNVLCRTAKISLDQKNPGATQIVKFAKTKNASDNDYRNLILQITTPLAYNMGEIYYTLKTVSYKKA